MAGVQQRRQHQPAAADRPAAEGGGARGQRVVPGGGVDQRDLPQRIAQALLAAERVHRGPQPAARAQVVRRFQVRAQRQPPPAQARGVRLQDAPGGQPLLPLQGGQRQPQLAPAAGGQRRPQRPVDLFQVVVLPAQRLVVARVEQRAVVAAVGEVGARAEQVQPRHHAAARPHQRRRSAARAGSGTTRPRSPARSPDTAGVSEVIDTTPPMAELPKGRGLCPR